MPATLNIARRCRRPAGDGELSKLHRSCGSVWLGTVPESPWLTGGEERRKWGDGADFGMWGWWQGMLRWLVYVLRGGGWDWCRVREEMGISKVRISMVYLIR